MSAISVGYSEGRTSPASLTREAGHRYKWLVDGNIYRQAAGGVSNLWVLDQGEPADGNGIYGGSGSLIEDTIVTMDTYKLQFDSPTLNGIFTVDGPNSRIGFGTAAPAHGVHIKTGNVFIDQGTLAVGATTPSNSYGILSAIDDTNGNDARCIRTVFSNETTTGVSQMACVEMRSLNTKTAGGTNNYRGWDVNFSGGATKGTYNMIGGRVRLNLFSNLGTSTINKYFLELTDGVSEGLGKVLADVTGTGLVQWVDPDTLVSASPWNTVLVAGNESLGNNAILNPTLPAIIDTANSSADLILRGTYNPTGTPINVDSVLRTDATVSFGNFQTEFSLTHNTQKVFSVFEGITIPSHYIKFEGTDGTNTYSSEMNANGLFNQYWDNGITTVGFENDFTNPAPAIGFLSAGGFKCELTAGNNSANHSITLPTDVSGTILLESAITEVMTFGGGATGDIATLTVTGGVITGRTLVP